MRLLFPTLKSHDAQIDKSLCFLALTIGKWSLIPYIEYRELYHLCVLVR